MFPFCTCKLQVASKMPQSTHGRMYPSRNTRAASVGGAALRPSLLELPSLRHFFFMSKHSDDSIPPSWSRNANGDWTDAQTGETCKILERYKSEPNGDHWFQCKVPGCRFDVLLRKGQNISQRRLYAKHAHDKKAIMVPPQCAPCNTPRLNQSVANMQSLTSTNTFTEFDGTKETTTYAPDGTVTFEKRIGKETTTEQKVVAMQAQITKLEETVAHQNDDMLETQMDDKRRIQSLAGNEIQSQRNQLCKERESMIALASVNSASPLDMHLLSLVASRYQKMFDLLSDSQRQTLRSQTVPNYNGWDAFEKTPSFTEVWKEKLNQVASDPNYYKTHFPLASAMFTPDELMDFNLWPKEYEVESDSDVESHVEEPAVVEAAVEEVESTSPLDDVPINQWMSDRMEAALRFCISKQWLKVERTHTRRYSPPALVKVIEKQKNYTEVGLDENKRIKNNKNVVRLLCRFQHPNGEEKDIWVKEATLKEIKEYKATLRATIISYYEGRNTTIEIMISTTGSLGTFQL